MANITRTVIDNGSIELEGGEFRDELLTFAAADTFVKGTLLARQSVVLAITPSAVTGTGNGTVTAASVVAGPDVPKVGNWVLRCVAAATNGGSFRLEDPDGAARGHFVLTAGSGGANAFEGAGLAFTINDGSTDFAVGDTFTLPVVTNSGKLVPYNPAGAGGAQRPLAVLTYEVTRASGGDLAVRPLIAGTVNKDRLIIDVDGTGANITAEILDQLRAAGIIALNVQQLSALDN
jgi:hypothetical protein